MAADDTSEIQAHIDDFVRDLESLIRQAAIESVKQALQATRGRARAERPVRTDGVQARRRRKGEKRSPEALEQLTQQLLQHVLQHPGQRIEQIAQRLGTGTRDLMLPARKLVAAKKIRKRGQKRATAYFGR
jgi:DNA-binding NtrC family response regulator